MKVTNHIAAAAETGDMFLSPRIAHGRRRTNIPLYARTHARKAKRHADTRMKLERVKNFIALGTNIL